MTKFASWWAAVLLCLAGTGLGAQSTVRLGSELQVSTHTVGFQQLPVVLGQADGFVVVWASGGAQDGNSVGVFGRRFDSAGSAQATEFQLNSYTVGYQGYPAAATDTDGDFVVAWHSDSQDGFDNGVFARRFDSAGTPQAAEFQVNSRTEYNQGYPAVALDADGDFVIAWQGYYGVFGQRFDSSGAMLGSEFQISEYTLGYPSYPAIAVGDNGDFVVAWDSPGQDGSGEGVFARRFDSSGVPQATELQVNTYTTASQDRPAIARDATGAFVVVWRSLGQDGSYRGVFAQRFDSTGAPQASEFQVNTYTTRDQTRPKVAADGTGAFIVVWDSFAQDGSYAGVFARRFDSSGAAQAAEFQVNTYTPSTQAGPSVFLDDAGGFVVAWDSYGQDGRQGSSVFIQRFATVELATLDIDGDGTTQPLTDGLLVLRFLFGFTGGTLTGNAVAMDCTRCEAAAIEAYLGGLGSVLDIDDDGATEALTDGLLVLRYLFGFTDGTLTNGAVGIGCNRCDAAAIEPYLTNLT